jgi:hypothetical protein
MLDTFREMDYMKKHPKILPISLGFDPYWIIILFFIYLDSLKVETIGGINL